MKLDSAMQRVAGKDSLPVMSKTTSSLAAAIGIGALTGVTWLPCVAILAFAPPSLKGVLNDVLPRFIDVGRAPTPKRFSVGVRNSDLIMIGFAFGIEMVFVCCCSGVR